jgi:hypothetical protein
MTTVRRLTQLTTIIAILATGVLLIVEIVGGIDSTWRERTADALRSLADPDLPDWALALLGLGLGLAAIVLIASQLAPEPKGRSRMFEVSKFDDGETRLAGRAALRSVEHELAGIDGVTGATAVMPRPKRIHATVRADDRCNLDDVITEARRRLDTPFWINLGLPDIAVEITAEFDPRPPRVR